MRYVVTLRRGGLYQRYECNYGSLDAAVFGVMRKQDAQDFAQDGRHWQSHSDAAAFVPLEISVNAGGTIPRLSKGARRVA